VVYFDLYRVIHYFFFKAFYFFFLGSAFYSVSELWLAVYLVEVVLVRKRRRGGSRGKTLAGPS
jgi:hypothetical protein